MKLNYECIRDVLLYLEEQEYYAASEEWIVEYEPVGIHQIADALNDYSLQELFYTLSNLAQADYIDVTEIGNDSGIAAYYVNSITFKGHEFLSHIKDAGRWAAVKKTLSAVKDYSLSAIGAIAQGVSTALIETHIKSKG